MLAILVLAFLVISLMHGLAQTFAMLFILRLLKGIVEGPLIPQTQSILAPVVIVELATKFDRHTEFYLTIIPGIILSSVILKSVRNPDPSKFHAMSESSINSKTRNKTYN